MRKLKILLVTVMMALLMAAPANAAIVINQFGTVNINSNNETTKDSNNDNSTSVEDSLIF